MSGLSAASSCASATSPTIQIGPTSMRSSFLANGSPRRTSVMRGSGPRTKMRSSSKERSRIPAPHSCRRSFFFSTKPDSSAA
jgi:hypothetical protein